MNAKDDKVNLIEDKDSIDLVFREGETEVNIGSSRANINNGNSEEYKIDKKLLKSFLNKYLVFSLIINGVGLGINIVFVNLNEKNLVSVFDKTWWLLIPAAIIISFCVIFSFFNRKRILSPYSNWSIYLISLHFFAYFILTMVLSFKFNKVLLSFYILLQVGLSMILLFNFISIFYDNDVLKLIIIYSYSFVHFIVYIILAKKYYVEFFILIVFSFLYFAYVNKELKKLLIDFVKKNEIVLDDKVPFKTVITAFLIMPVDLVLASFK